MGRQVRRVPPDWRHPRKSSGDYYPLFDEDYPTAMKLWREDGGAESSEWQPELQFYRPVWTDEERTAYQVYEIVSEGTPVSPVFKTRGELVDWLVNDGSGMGLGGSTLKMDKEQAERFADAGGSPTIVSAPGKPVSSGTDIYKEGD